MESLLTNDIVISYLNQQNKLQVVETSCTIRQNPESGISPIRRSVPPCGTSVIGVLLPQASNITKSSSLPAEVQAGLAGGAEAEFNEVPQAETVRPVAGHNQHTVKHSSIHTISSTQFNTFRVSNLCLTVC